MKYLEINREKNVLAVIWHKYNIEPVPVLATIGPVVSKEFRDNKRWQAHFSDPYTIRVRFICITPSFDIKLDINNSNERETS